MNDEKQVDETTTEKPQKGEPVGQSKLMWVVIIIFIAVVVWFGRGRLDAGSGLDTTTEAPGTQQFNLQGMSTEDIKNAFDACATDPACSEQDFIKSLEEQFGS